MNLCKCGNQTRDKEGICASCRFRVRMIEEGLLTPNKTYDENKNFENEGGDMSAPEDRQCKIEGCKKWTVKGAMCKRHGREAQGITPKKREPKPKEQAPKLSSQEGQKINSPLSRRVGKRARVRGKSDDGNYTITINLSPYPDIHKRLIEIAQSEFRSPEMQLMKMLDEEFKRRE